MKIITLRLDEKVYEELLKRAKEEGFSTVAEYLNTLILRIVEEKPQISGVREGVEDSSKKSFVVDRLLSLIERKIQDNINPFTQKIDDLGRRVAMIIERIEGLEERVNSLEEKVKNIEALRTESREQKRVRKTAIEILREQKAIFERDIVSKIRDRDSFFARLEREGAIVIEAKDERIAVEPQFWHNFISKLKNVRTNNDEELKKLLDPIELRLMQKLRESALLVFDGTSKSWSLLL